MAYAPKKIQRPWVKERKPQQRVRTPVAFDYNCRAWRKKAKAQLAKQPLCEECLRNGLTSLAGVADHIVPIAQGGDPWDDDNLQSLGDYRTCRCHEKKSAKEKGRMG